MTENEQQAVVHLRSLRRAFKSAEISAHRTKNKWINRLLGDDPDVYAKTYFSYAQKLRRAQTKLQSGDTAAAVQDIASLKSHFDSSIEYHRVNPIIICTGEASAAFENPKVDEYTAYNRAIEIVLKLVR